MIKRFGGHAGQESILNDHRRSSSEVPKEPSIGIVGEFAPALLPNKHGHWLEVLSVGSSVGYRAFSRS
jgi:hypothetical protein